jgi:hypothetical protein
MAPAEVPLMIGKGLAVTPASRRSWAMAASTPT